MALFNQPTQYTTDVSSINKQIAQESAQSAAFFGQLIAAEHAYNSQAAKDLQSIAPLLGKAGQFVQNQRAINEAIEDSKTFDLTDEEFNTKYKGKEYDAKLAEADKQTSAEQTAGAQEDDPFARDFLWSGDRPRKNNKKMLIGMEEDYGAFFSRAESELQTEYPKGSGNFMTLADATNPAERKYLKEAIRSVWLKQAAGTDDNPTSLYERRKYLHPGMKKVEEARDAQWVKAYDTATKVNAQNERTFELNHDVKARGGAGIEDHIKKYVGVYSGTKDGWKVAKKKTFDLLIDSEQITSSDLSAIGDHTVTGHDGGKHKLSKYWEKDYDRLVKSVTDREREEFETREQMKTNEQNSWAESKVEEWEASGEPVTEDMLDEAGEAFRKEFPGVAKVPDSITKYYTLQDEADDSIVQRLENTVKRGDPIYRTDLKGITDNNILQTWLPRVTAASVFSLDQDGQNTRDTRIKGRVNQITKEQAIDGKSPRWIANVEGATAYFNAQFAKHVKTDSSPEGRAAALSEAWKDTLAGINAGDFNEYIDVPLHEPTQRNTHKALAAFNKDNNIINTAVLPGTKDDVQQARKYVETNGAEGSLPTIYRQLSSYTGASPFKVAQIQVALAAKADGETPPKFEEAKVDQDIESQLSLSDRFLLRKKPSQGKTNRVIVNNENLNWYIDNSKRFDDYDHILSPTGGDAHLEKPLTEHTIEEVVELLESGHQSPGAFAFTPTELLEAAQSTGIYKEQIFSKKIQEQLAAALPRAHVNRNYKGGFYTDLIDLAPIDFSEDSNKNKDIPLFNKNENILPALKN